MIYEMKQKSVAFDTRSKRNGKKKKVSKGLNTGAVRGKSGLLMCMQEDIWIKKNPPSPSPWHFNHR